MNNIANISDIAIFLENAKALISAGRYDFVPRRKNMQSLAQHGLTKITQENGTDILKCRGFHEDDFA